MSPTVKDLLIVLAVTLLMVNMTLIFIRQRRAALKRNTLGLNQLIGRRFLFMLTLICTAFAVIFAFMAQNERKQSIEAFQKLELNDARRMAQDLEREIQLIQTQLRSLSDNPLVQDARRKVTQTFRRAYSRVDRRWVRELTLADLEGKIVVSIPNEFRSGADVSSATYNVQFLKTRRPMIAGPFAGPNGLIAIAVQQPIEKNGNFTGWITAMVDFRCLLGYFCEPLTTGDIAQPGLLDSDGRILVDINPGIPPRSIFDLAGNDPAQIELARRMLRDQDGTFRYLSKYTSAGQQVKPIARAGAFARVHLGGGNYWVAGVTAEEPVILGQFPMLNWPQVAVFLLFIALVILATGDRLRDEHRYTGQLEKEITKRVEELGQSEGRFRRLFEQSPVGMILLDAQGNCLDVNAAFAGMFGIPLEHFKDYNILQDPAWIESGLAASLQRAFSGEGGSAFDESRLRIASGAAAPRDVFFSGAIMPDTDAHGALATVLLSCMDVTGRHQAEDARLLLATVVEQSTEAIFLTDTRAVVQYVNPAFCVLTGLQPAHALGRHARRLLAGPGNKVLCRTILACLEEGVSWHGRVAGRQSDGTQYEVEAAVSPVRDGAGRVTQYVFVGRDVTLERTLQTQLLQSQKMEAVGKLAGGVAHDFNNVLTAIIGNLQLAQMRGGPLVQKNLHDALTASTRATEMVRQLLTFSRKSSGVREPIVLNSLVRETARLVEKSIDRRIQLSTFLDESLPPVNADPNQMHQVLMNLCVNARDAILERIHNQIDSVGGQGRNYQIGIQTRVERVNEEYCRTHSFAHTGRYAVLIVGDEGVGMDRETMARIFEPFFTTKADGQGTGLGLSTVYGIVKSHNGWVHVASEPGCGAVFKIYLPIVDSPVPVEVA